MSLSDLLGGEKPVCHCLAYKQKEAEVSLVFKEERNFDPTTEKKPDVQFFTGKR